MAFPRWKDAARLALVSLVLAVPSAPGVAQNSAPTQAQRAGIASLIQGAAKTIYWFAWPTATYSDWSLHSIEPVAGGFDVVITLDGRSGIDNSDLWLRLKLQLRSDGIHGYSVVSHNAFWRDPFATVRDMGELAGQVERSMAEQQARDRAAAQAQEHARAQAYAENQARARAYAENQAQIQAQVQAQARASAAQTVPAQVVAACITNNTGNTIHFMYRDGDADWQQSSLDAGAALSLSRPYAGSAVPLTVQYSGYTQGVVHTYSIQEAVSAVPLVCSRVVQYQFASQGNDLLIYRLP